MVEKVIVKICKGVKFRAVDIENGGQDSFMG